MKAQTRRGIKIALAGVAFGIVLLLVGCGGGGGGGSSSSSNPSPTTTKALYLGGLIADESIRNSPMYALEVDWNEADNGQVSGKWYNRYQERIISSGTFNGQVNADSTVTLVLSRTDGCPGSYNATGTLISGELSLSFTGNDCTLATYNGIAQAIKVDATSGIGYAGRYSADHTGNGVYVTRWDTADAVNYTVEIREYRKPFSGSGMNVTDYFLSGTGYDGEGWCPNHTLLVSNAAEYQCIGIRWETPDVSIRTKFKLGSYSGVRLFLPQTK